jgi:hypothetical protein
LVTRRWFVVTCSTLRRIMDRVNSIPRA